MRRIGLMLSLVAFAGCSTFFMDPLEQLRARNKKNLEQLHLLLGVPAYPENFRGRYPLFVMNALLGGTMSSRLAP